jgi:hypothetical protein
MGVRRWRTTALMGATALIAAAALAGCSADSSDQASTSGAAPAIGEADPNSDVAPAEGGSVADSKDAAAKGPDLRVDQRAIIYTGSITVRVDDVNQAAAKVTAIAAGAGGFVGGDKRSSGSGAAEASLELRVPADRFSSVVDQLAGLGKEEQRGINTEDVTEETIDLDARIATQTARVASGRKLLAQAKTLSELVMLEGEVAKREADLASLTAKKRRLADLTALSTITAVLLDPEAVQPSDDDDPAGFLGGLKGGWNALVASLAVLLTVLGALLPWVIVIGLPIWGLVVLYRRYAKRNPRPAVPVHTPLFAGAPGPLPAYPPRSQHQPGPAAPSAPSAQSAPARPTSGAPASGAPASGAPASGVASAGPVSAPPATPGATSAEAPTANPSVPPKTPPTPPTAS